MPTTSCSRTNVISSSARRGQLPSSQGLARGADTLGTHYARERGIQVLEFPADWERLGRRAGMVRNLQMLEAADAVVAFWDGQSRGTAHTIGEAKKRGLPLRVVRY